MAEAIVDTVRDALLVLDAQLNVVAASRSYYLTFDTTPEDTLGKRIYDLGAGLWDNGVLRDLLGRLVPEHQVLENFELRHDSGPLGHRIMLLNARKVFYEDDKNTTLLLTIEDITERRGNENMLKQLSEQKDMLLSEMSHRVANSLQIIASILLLKAHSVQSDEIRNHLEDAHRRVMSVAALQQQLQASGHGDRISVGDYLARLTSTLTASMIGDRRAITLNVTSDAGDVVSEEAVSIGLIVTELVINALKHAFPLDVKAGHITVSYKVAGEEWTLAVKDDGQGMKIDPARKISGLGMSIVKALAQQLGGIVQYDSSDKGTTVSINHKKNSSAV